MNYHLDSLFLTVIMITASCLTLRPPKLSYEDSSGQTDDKTIQAVFIIMRHGAKAHNYSWPKLPQYTTNNLFPNGVYQLTDKGKEQVENVANFLRSRYEKLIPEDSRRALIRSSNTDRTLDSAAIVGKVFWPPKINDSSWLPTRIFSIPTLLDPVLAESFCPNGDQETYVNSLQTPDAIDLMNEIQPLLNLISAFTGLNASIDELEAMYEPIISLISEGIDLPEWATEEVIEKLGKAFAKRTNLWYASLKSKTIRAGSFIKELVKRIEGVKTDILVRNKNGRKLFYYLSHDYNLGSILVSMGINLTSPVPTAGAVIFELHSIEEQFVVRLFYLNQTRHHTIRSPIPLLIQSTKTLDCNLEHFERLMTPLIPIDWTNICGFNYSNFFEILENYLDPPPQKTPDFHHDSSSVTKGAASIFLSISTLMLLTF